MARVWRRLARADSPGSRFCQVHAFIFGKVNHVGQMERWRFASQAPLAKPMAPAMARMSLAFGPEGTRTLSAGINDGPPAMTMASLDNRAF
jgi:hypothetical protein